MRLLQMFGRLRRMLDSNNFLSCCLHERIANSMYKEAMVSAIIIS